MLSPTITYEAVLDIDIQSKNVVPLGPIIAYQTLKFTSSQNVVIHGN